MPAASKGCGEVIGGRYRIVRAVGSGAFGSVYEAMRPDGGRVAVKIMHEHLAEASERWRFEREGALLIDLRHPNIVSLLEYGLAGAEPYLVFELLDGRSLADEIARVGFMSASRVAGIARQVLAALAETHLRGIVHRDIKPSNVHLCSSDVHVDRVKLLDFGVAKAIGVCHASFTEPGAIVGSPGYMAPEQIRGGEVSPASDLFALAVVMTELLTGQRFMGETLLEVCRLHLEDGPFVIPRAARASELGDVIARALEKEPRSRFDSARDMLLAIDRCMCGASSSPRSASGTLLLPEHLDSEQSPASTIPLEDLVAFLHDEPDEQP
jgi:eukaryotic-like serine/threonine-protein kinase